VARGVCQVNDSGLLQGVEEWTGIEHDGDSAINTNATGQVTRLTGDEVVSMNMWGFTPQIFGQLRELFQSFLELNSSSLQAEFYITSAVNELLMSGQARVMVLQTRDSWFGVTYREDHPHVVENLGRLIQDGCYPKRLWP